MSVVKKFIDIYIGLVEASVSEPNWFIWLIGDLTVGIFFFAVGLRADEKYQARRALEAERTFQREMEKRYKRYHSKQEERLPEYNGGRL